MFPDYEGIVIRPPSEADSLILQVTLGCSDNKCVFCPAYKKEEFKIKPIDIVFKEIDIASKIYPDMRKIFLADGDALIAPYDYLISVYDHILKKFKDVRRISLYASNRSILLKKIEELEELKKRKMSLVYTGFETGDSEIYKMICKNGSPQDNITAVLKLKEAGIRSNITIITGLGGKKYSYNNAFNTAKILNLSKPEQIAALTLMIEKNTPLYEMLKSGEFEPLNEFEYIEELKVLIENLDDFKCLFFANHASNFLPIEARFPKDKIKVLSVLRSVLANKNRKDLKPDFLRGL